jgi:hypothetical protein
VSLNLQVFSRFLTEHVIGSLCRLQV